MAFDSAEIRELIKDEFRWHYQEACLTVVDSEDYGPPVTSWEWLLWLLMRGRKWLVWGMTVAGLIAVAIVGWIALHFVDINDAGPETDPHREE